MFLRTTYFVMGNAFRNVFAAIFDLRQEMFDRLQNYQPSRYQYCFCWYQ
jgi:hypothetical protein